MKKFFALALLAAVAFVGCTPNDPNNGGGTEPIQPCTEHDADYILNEVSGIYYGNFDGEIETMNYGLVLSNQPNVFDIMSGQVTILPNSQYLFLDLYSSVAAPNHSVTFKVPNGVYNLDLENSAAVNTTSYEFTNLFVTSEEEGVETFFKSGTVTVTDNLIEALLVGEDDKVYHVKAPNKLVDNTHSYGNGAAAGEYSTLTEDLQIPFDSDDLEFYAENWSDYLVVGKNLWVVYVDDWTSGDEFMLMLLADKSKSIPVGTFELGGDLSKEVALFGYVDGYGEASGSWYFKDYGESGLAPIKSGSVTISVSEEGVVTTQINVKDDKGNTLSGTCVTDVVTVDDPNAAMPFSVGKKAAKQTHKVSLAPRTKVKPTLVLKK